MSSKNRVPIVISFCIFTIVLTATAFGLDYGTYIFTTNDIIIFSYEDNTDIEVYNSNETLVWNNEGNPLDKGEHGFADLSQGVYKVIGSNKFTVLCGDPSTEGISGYYAMDPNGLGTGTEFYTFVPYDYDSGDNKFIIFAYDADTTVTVEKQEPNGLYIDVDTFSLDKGGHWANANLSSKYLHITADKPVSALSCYDVGYVVPSTTGKWNGTEFYTYVSEVGWWDQDLIVTALHDNTSVTIRETDDPNTIVWSGVLDSGLAHIENDERNKYYTIESDKDVSVAVTIWVSTPVMHGLFIPSADGTLIGKAGADLIGSTDSGGYLNILAYTDNTNVWLYDSETDELQGKYNLDKGEYENIYTGAGLWRIVCDRYVSVYERNSIHNAEFAPLAFGMTWSLVKDNNDPNNDCVRPFDPCENNYLDFDIYWDVNGNTDTNVALIDYLPEECDYYSSTPAGDYNSTDHTVTWVLGDISADDANSFFLRTKVNNWARPGDTFTNLVIMEGDNYFNTDTEDCNVCAWGGEIIYVDKDANGYNNGTSWDDAYNLLQDGFTGARNCGAAVTAIWAAEGTYKPVYDTNDTSYKNESFELIEDVGVFGHFGGVGTYETSTSQRNFSDPNNETVLEGKIGASVSDAVKNIIKAEDIDDGLVDGFTIQGSYGGSGIYLNDADASIINCKLKNNRNYGVHVENYSYPDIHNCTFIDNYNSGVYSSTSQPDISYSVLDGNDSTYYGLYMQSGSSIDVTNSIFKNHNNYGVYGSNGTLVIEDSLFENNNKGLDITDVTTTLNWCSIKQSQYYGVWASNSDLTVEHSVIHGSQYNNGIYMQSYSNLDLVSSVIRYSGAHGVHLQQNSQTNIKNCWIHNNGDYSSGSGIYFDKAIEDPLVRNNTLYDNYTYGIQSSEQGGNPNVLNCIIYGNDSNDFYRENGAFDTVNYCNLQNPHSGTGNITGDPGFVNIGTDPNDLHLDETSQCKNAGEPNVSYGDETDIDGEGRIQYGRVDIGADEYYWSPADFDEDGYVNLIDYAIFADSWKSESGDGRYNDDCDLQDNNSIDYNDLTLFCEDWLWEKGWDEGWMMCMGGGGGFGFEGMSMMESLSLDLSEAEVTSAESNDSLMLSASESFSKRPERLIAKSQKFYDITAPVTITVSQTDEWDEEELDMEPDWEAMIEFLDKVWFSGELKECMTEEEYLEFRKILESHLQ